MPNKRNLLISSPTVIRAAMCRRRGDALASQPTIRPDTRSTRSRTSNAASSATSSSTLSFPSAIDSSSGAAFAATTTTSSSSIASLRVSLTEKPIFSLAEIAAATNNFLAKPISSTSSAWRCSLRGRDAIVFQRPFHGDPNKLPARLAAVCRSHHRSLVSILGASLSANRIYFVYEFVQGASLADCLHNPRNPNFTPLSTWISRIQVATDLAQGLEYIHHHSAGSGTLHNRIKSSTIIVTEPQSNAMICHFGAAYLAGDVPDDQLSEDEEGGSSSFSKMSKTSGSRSRRIEGTRGYLAPELTAGGSVSRRSDVFALGVVLLELISGEEPVENMFDRDRKEYRSSSLIETARNVVGARLEEEVSSATATAELAGERKRRIREWVDRRLKDSFPIEVVEKLTEIALRCVEADAARRPSMTWVEGRVSKLFLESKAWAERIRVPTEITMSLGPR
ncbi:LysM domain receptor-like kinase 3 [Platanthera guangdongensis]|uniref:LysM domain receptor-like kinase 3 n=1 Tax=Platanthera guangdongensis TaxID=2320717 RepID=A0ABR2LPN9_9ASPA